MWEFPDGNYLVRLNVIVDSGSNEPENLRRCFMTFRASAAEAKLTAESVIMLLTRLRARHGKACPILFDPETVQRPTVSSPDGSMHSFDPAEFYPTVVLEAIFS